MDRSMASRYDEERLRQTVAAKGRRQLLLHRLALLISTGTDAQRITRMVVDHRQGVARCAIGERHLALEVHLPEQVGRLLLESLIWPLMSMLRLPDETVTAQVMMHGRSRR